ncbi:MAG: response regulator [Chitinivibrionales bacterium]|nr:response regulator [Chitinivibrionales bacterium]
MKAYLVEDDETMRFILKHILEANFPSLTAIGESETGEDALEKVPSFGADVVLVDISLPGMSGLEFVRRLTPKCRGACILVLTGHEIEMYEQAARDAGAHGIISKSDDEGLLEMIGILLEKSKQGGCE